jgi:acyl-CoA thioester hydrolase
MQADLDIPRVSYGTVRRIDVHIDDMDPSGVVHNARYAILFERAIALFWAEYGVTFAEGRPTSPDMIVVVREFSIRYRRPINSAGPVDVHFWLEEMNETSRAYAARFLSTDHRTVHAEARRVMVTIDPRTGRPTPMTPQSRAIAETLRRAN